MINIEQFDRNVRGRFRYLPERIEGMDVAEDSGILRIDSGLRSDMFNILCCTGTADQPRVQATIDGARKRRRPFCWWVGFSGEPDHLTRWLEAADLQASEQELAMVLSLEGYEWTEPSTELDVRPVRSEQAVDDVVRVMHSVLLEEEKPAIAEFFRRASPFLMDPESPLRFLVGYHAETPVATSSVFMDTGLAAIYDVIAHPDFRGRGYGSHMTMAAMKEGANKGFSTAALTATEGAKALYSKLGFQALKPLCVYTLA